MTLHTKKHKFKFVTYIIRLLKKIKIPGYSNIYAYQVVRILFYQINKFGIGERASIVSFNLIMAIAPMFMFLLSFTPYIPFISSKFEKETLSMIKEFVPDHLTYLNIRFIVKDLFSKPKNPIYSFSFFLMLYFASNTVMALISSFDKSVENKKQIKWITRRLKSIGITLMVIFLFIVLISLMALQNYLIVNITQKLHIKSLDIKHLLSIIRIIMFSLFIFIMIALIYKFGPSKKLKWRLFSLGAILASVFYIIVSFIFNYWTTNYMLYTQKYGPLGTLILVFTLIYIFSFIILVGFELNQSIDIAEDRIQKSKKQIG